jgi:UDP-glucose 4-epimerase
VIGTLNLLLAARDSGVRRVVFASSSSVYGANEELPKREQMAVTPISPYAVAKLASEGYCRSFWEVYELETVSLRYFNVFGPRQDPLSQYAAVIPKFIRSVLAGRQPTIFGDGEQSRDFTFVDHVVEANVLAIDAPDVGGQVFNVACGQRVTINQLVEELGRIVGVDIAPHYEPARAGDVPHSLADIEKAKRMLGYRPAIGFREGLTRTFEHLRGLAQDPSAAQSALLR